MASYSPYVGLMTDVMMRMLALTGRGSDRSSSEGDACGRQVLMECVRW